MRLLNVDLLSPTDEIVLYSYKHMYNSKQATVNVSTWHWLPRKHEPMLAKKHMQPRAYENAVTLLKITVSEKPDKNILNCICSPIGVHYFVQIQGQYTRS